MSPWGRVVDARLADGAWHEVDDVITVAAVAVPPGTAYRAGERLRRNNRADSPASRVKGDAGVAIATGARALVAEAIRSRVRYGHAERSGTAVRAVRGGS